jgi:hypothetical protein
MIKYSIFLFICLFLLTFELTEKKYQKTSFYVLMIFLILISGLRYKIGNDFTEYIRYFHSFLKNYNSYGYVEPGFKYIVLFCAFLGLNWQLLFFIFSFLTIILFAIFFKKYSKYPLLSAFIFFTFPIFYLTSLDLIREYLAIAIFTYSLRFIEENNFIKYIVTILIGALFHFSILVCIPLYFLFKIKKIIPFVVIYSFLFFLGILFIKIVLHFIDISNIYLMHMFHYKPNPTLIVLSIFFFIFFLINKNKLLKIDSSNIFFLKLYYLSIPLILTPLISNFPAEGFIRMSTYFTISIMILFPNYIKSINNKYLRATFTTVLIFASLIYFYHVLYIKGYANHLIPYKININFTKNIY